MKQTEVFDLLKEFAGQSSILTIPLAFIRYAGSLEAALLLSQIVYWSGRTEDGWFYKSYPDWEEELTLGEYEIRKAVKSLKDKGILETRLKKANGAPTLHYRLKQAQFSESILHFLKNRSFKISRNQDSLKSEESINIRLPKTTYSNPAPAVTEGSTFQNPNLLSPVAQEPKRARPRDALFDALAEVCRVNPRLMTAEQRGAMNQTLGKLREAGHTPQQLREVGEWWRRFDWRGKRGQAPRPHEVREVWDQAFAPVTIVDEHPNAYRPGKMIL